MTVTNYAFILLLQSGLPLLVTMLLLGRDETLRRLSNALQFTEVEIALGREEE